MKKKVNTSIFISGRGSNLKSLIQFSLLKNSPIKINVIITDNIKAKGLTYADKYKIKKKIIKFNDKGVAENKILKILTHNNVKLICLAGFMKVLSKNFIKRFKGNILNIHPSLLPKYKGLNTHERVMENNEKFSGCTVHLVSPKLDSGKIILQKKVRILKSDNPNKLAKNILKQEHFLYPRAIKKLFN